jgi:hypothetical protein
MNFRESHRIASYSPFVITLVLGVSLFSGVGCERREPEQVQVASPGPPVDQQAPTAPHGPNAAGEYRTIHEEISRELRSELAASAGSLTPRIEALLPAAQPLISRLVAASKLEHCDWRITYSMGVELPHLAHMRLYARLLAADTEWAILEGDPDAAAANVAAMFRMSRHVGGKSVIEALVAFAISHLAANLVDANAGTWTTAQAISIIEELQKIDQNDPFDGDAKLEWERRLAAESGSQGPDEAFFHESREMTRRKLAQAIRQLR